MTEFITRREMREAERRGEVPVVVKTPEPDVEIAVPVETLDVHVESAPVPAAAEPQVFLSRREMREAERKRSKRLSLRMSRPWIYLRPISPEPICLPSQALNQSCLTWLLKRLPCQSKPVRSQ